MNNFKKDVISMERRLGGDMCIFENLEEKRKTLKSIIKQLFTPINTKQSKKKEGNRKSLPLPKVLMTHEAPMTYKPTTATGYSCQSQVGCNFTTIRYVNLKQHMASHKNDTDVVITKKSSTNTISKKRKNFKTESEIKKQKLQEKLLKDCDNDGEDEDELNINKDSKV